MNIKNQIISWLDEMLESTKQNGFVVGVSGGIDSAVVSTLCALTGNPTICLSLPIHQNKDHLSRAEEHFKFLKELSKSVTVGKVTTITIDLTDAFESFKKVIGEPINDEVALANIRSRLRMVALYSYANQKNYLVVGTGNKIEDMGIGFFTKFGDGGVDISPIGDLTKTEVYELGEKLGIIKSIMKAKPSDGLYNNCRSDEDTIGATYPELEKAMKFCNDAIWSEDIVKLSQRDFEVLKIYMKRHNKNEHKMSMPPICIINKDQI